MNAVSRKGMQMAPSATYHWYRLLALAVVLAGCGGPGGLHTSSKSSGGDGTAAAGASGGGGNGDVGGVMASGGSTQGWGGMPIGGGGGAGGTTTGGAGGPASGRSAGAGGAGGAGVATGGVTSQGGSPGAGQDGGAIDGEILASPDAPCDLLFWLAVAEAMGIDGLCMPTPDGQTSWGEIVLDSEGRVIYITRFGASDPGLLDRLAGGQWPCMAGQTIQYFCDVGG